MRSAEKDYRRVTPTPEERAEWHKKHGYSWAPPWRIECRFCGKRMWLSGIGIGSHRRACKGPA